MNDLKREEFDNYLKIGIDRAKSSLYHFFELLEIDPKLFNHLFDIDIFIDYDNRIINLEKENDMFVDSEIAIYQTADNDINDEIAVSKDFIMKLVLFYNEDLISRQDIINEIAVTIIHEILHRNRTIILDKTLKIDDVSYYDKYNELYKDYDIDTFKVLLDKSISSGFYNYFDSCVPIKAVFKENNIFDVVSYNKKTDCFDIYNNQIFGFLNDNVTLLKIGLELNSEELNHQSSISIPYKNGPYEKEYYAGSIAYYHQSNLNESKTKRNIRLENVTYLEESLVETLAKLIIYSRKKDKIDLDSFNEVLSSSEVHDTIKLGGIIIKTMGLSMIKWFILSSYEEEYDDKLYKTFTDKYETLLLYFKKLSESKTNNDEVENVKKILNEKIR